MQPKNNNINFCVLNKEELDEDTRYRHNTLMSNYDSKSIKQVIDKLDKQVKSELTANLMLL